MIHDKSLPALHQGESGLKTAITAAKRWPFGLYLYIVALVALYAQILWETGQAWLTNENYSHGIFIFPISIWLLWIQRKQLREMVSEPTIWGLFPLSMGLLLEIVGYLLNVKFLAMISLIPVLAGSILIFYGKEVWKRARFATCFLFFAAPVPGFLLLPLTVWIQSVSSTGARLCMQSLGYPVLQTGNVLQIPGMSVEVAEACSGFKKVIALFAFALVYGYLYRLSPFKRFLLVVAAIPIALLANIIRISGLIAAGSAGGIKALHSAHDMAEMLVLVIAFILFVWLGRILGCKIVSRSS